MENSIKILKSVLFSQLKSWDVKSYFRHTEVFNPQYPIVLFGDFLSKAEIKKINIEDNKEYKILGVRSYGKGAFINRVVNGNTLKMRTYQVAEKDHLFWCKVDTKNGAFGIINEDLSNGVASSNMTFAKIDLEKANPQYIQLLFQSKKVNQYMDSYVTGTTNRKYIKPDQLREEIQIPLPSLKEQNRIVANYNKKIQLANKQDEKAKQLEKEIENYLFNELGIEKLEEKENAKGLQFIQYKNLLEWNISNLDKEYIKSDLFPTVTLNNRPDIFEEIFRGKSPKYDINGTFVILNQKCNRWNEIKLEFAKNVNDNWFKSIDNKFFTKKDDIIINSTGNGTIGRASRISDNFENLIYDSHILLLRLNKQKINSLYFTYLFNSTFGQEQVENIKSAQSTNQTELGVANLKKIVFPFPPIEIQNKIANYISKLKQQIKDLQQQAKENRKMAIQEFENEIFIKN